MKTKLIIGSILAIFILLMVPSVPAVEYNVAIETNKTTLIEELQTIDIDELEQRLKNINNEKIQDRLKSIDFDLLKQKIEEITANSPHINVLYLISFILIVAYQVVLGRPSIILMPFTILSFIIVVSDFVTGRQTPACPIAYAFVPYMVINIIGLFAYKNSPSKAIGLAIAIVLYLISYVILLIAASVEQSLVECPSCT